jgi:hypothetical protein
MYDESVIHCDEQRRCLIQQDLNIKSLESQIENLHQAHQQQVAYQQTAL